MGGSHKDTFWRESQKEPGYRGFFAKACFSVTASTFCEVMRLSSVDLNVMSFTCTALKVLNSN